MSMYTLLAFSVLYKALRPVCIQSVAPRSVYGENSKAGQVEMVEEFEYQGSSISRDCLQHHAIDNCIRKASHTFHSLYRLVHVVQKEPE